MKSILIALLVLCVGTSMAVAQPAIDPENTLYLDLEHGRAVIRMRPDLAPVHVARIKQLVRGGFYDGMVFHRVIPGFIAQTGDPFGTGAGGTGRKLKAEFSRTPAVRGVVAMARKSGKDTADSQFFIVLGDGRAALDGKYTVWGEVEAGMDAVDRIKTGDAARDGKVNDPDRVVRMRVAADVDGSSRATPTPADFSAVEFRCAGLADGPGAAGQADLARLWAHGYAAGYARARGQLTFGARDGLGATLREACGANPAAFLLPLAESAIAKAAPALPETIADVPIAATTCADYSRGPTDRFDLWAFAFIQGFKNVAQPGLEIAFDDKPKLMAPFAKFCAGNPDKNFADLAGLVAEKVKLK